MNHFFKGAVVIAAVAIVNIIVNLACNMNGVDLDSTTTGTISAVCAMLIYHGWTKDENKKE